MAMLRIESIGRKRYQRKMNLIPKDEERVAQEIFLYLSEVSQRTVDRLPKIQEPYQQHTLPQFILKMIAANSPANYTKESSLLLKEYRMEYNHSSKTLTDFIVNPQSISPKKYTVQSKIYNSNIFENEYYMEVMLSIIETDASRLIHSKISEVHSEDDPKDINPYYFNLPNLVSFKPNKLRCRVILACFFAFQFLRSNDRKEILESMARKHNLVDLDFSGLITAYSIPAILQTYYRQWIWIRMPNHETITSELGSVTVDTCSGHAGSIMTLLRRDFIYFHEIPGTHKFLDDKVMYSHSSIIHDWFMDSLLYNICKIFKENTNGIMEISFVSNQKAFFSTKNLYKPQGCCFGCALNPARNNPKNQLFVSTDISI